MRDINIAITAASYSGNKGAAAMLQSSIKQLHDKYGERLNINLMSVYPRADREQVPYDFVKIIPTPPEKLLFVAFPCAILHKAFCWLPPVRKLLEKQKILKAYKNTDMVLDEAGISFVDSRGFVMNTYAFVCAAVPMLMGVPVVKYSQAMGTFKNPWNRFLAKWILKKMPLVCARGKITEDNLNSIGIKDNVRLCADGAFTMRDDPDIKAMVDQRRAEDEFYSKDVVGLSISSVVLKKCNNLNIDYVKITADFIKYLNERGYNVLMIANAARLGSEKPRNNDLLVGDMIYDAVENKDGVRWYHEEMQAEEIREYIAGCRFLVASRFHSMIGALEKKVPVLLIGWSHKYKEVLDMFGLGQYATDFSNLNLKGMTDGFENLEKNEDLVRENIEKNYDNVMASSLKNIEYVSRVVDDIIAQPYKKKKFLDYKDPDQYIGRYKALRHGYSTDSAIRENAASGGMVTGLLCHMLDKGEIDGAWVTKTCFKDGHLTYDNHIATTKEDIMNASSSVYMNIPQLQNLMKDLKEFDGKIAVTLVPCMMKAFTQLIEKEPELKDKVALKLGLYCSGCPSFKSNDLFMKKAGVDMEKADRLYYRRGHWRGESEVIYKDGTRKMFSYTKIVCAYKNAYYFEQEKCTKCKDHYAEYSDISFGDIWNKEMKKDPIKHTCCVIRSDRALEIFNEAVSEGRLHAVHMSARDMVRGQKRALVFKFLCSDDNPKKKWNIKLASYLAKKNKEYSEKNPEALMRKPTFFVYYYMCFIRVLLSF